MHTRLNVHFWKIRDNSMLSMQKSNALPNDDERRVQVLLEQQAGGAIGYPFSPL
jgi:hypothetical protein